MPPLDPSDYLDTLTKLYPFLHQDLEETKKRIEATLRQQLKATKLDQRTLVNLAALLDEKTAPVIRLRDGRVTRKRTRLPLPTLARYREWAAEQGCSIHDGVLENRALTVIFSPDRADHALVTGHMLQDRLAPHIIDDVERRLGLCSPWSS